MRKKLNKILVTMILLITSIICTKNISMSSSWHNNDFNGTLKAGWYCIQEGAWSHNGPVSSYDVDGKATPIARATLHARRVTGYNHWDPTLNQWVSGYLEGYQNEAQYEYHDFLRDVSFDVDTTYIDSSRLIEGKCAPKGASDTEKAKAEGSRALAFALATYNVGYGNVGAPTPTQSLVWKAYEGGTIYDFDVDSIPGLREYLSIKDADVTVGKKGKKKVECDNYKLGPFNIKYSGVVTEIIVEYEDKDENGNTKVSTSDENSGIKILQGEGGEILENGKEVALGKDKKFSNELQKTKDYPLNNKYGYTIPEVFEIEQNTDFYVINPSDREVKNVTIKVEQKHKNYWADCAEIRGGVVQLTNGQAIGGVDAGWEETGRDVPSTATLEIDPQDKMWVRGSGEKPCETKADFTFDVDVYKDNPRICKSGIWNNEEITLQGMQFKVYCPLYDKWVGDSSTGYVKNSKNATVFTTNSKGIAKLSDIYSGESFSYDIYEIGKSKDCDEKTKYYSDPMKVTRKTNPELEYEEGKLEKNQCYVFKDFELEGSIVPLKPKLYIIDDPTYGDLEINKISKKNNDRKLRGVEFKIYSKDRKQWLLRLEADENGIYNYIDIDDKKYDDYFTDNFEEAGTFATDKEGKIDIRHIPIGDYEIWETRTFGIEYDISEQEVYDAKKDASLLDTITISDKTTTVSKTFENIEREKGNLKVRKQGVYGINGELITEILPGMSFKIYSDVPGHNKFGNWVVIKEDPELYPDGPIVDFVENFDEGQIFTTDANGELEVDGLYLDFNDYVLVEVPNPSTIGQDVDTYYIDRIEISGAYNPTAGKMNVNGQTYSVFQGVTIAKDTLVEYTVTDNRTSSDLTVEKYDYTYNDLALEGAEFKIQLLNATYLDGVSGMWLKALPDGSYDYTHKWHQDYLTADVNEAAVFTTDDVGKFQVRGIVNGTYQIFETKTAIGYDIRKQDGYESDYGWVRIGDPITLSTEYSVVTYKLYNKKIVDSLEGTVWVDEPDTKANVSDNVLVNSSKDYAKQGITVNLRDKTTGELKATTTTDANGVYQFKEKMGDEKDIFYWELADSYLEFMYNNKYIDEQNLGYTVVDPFVGEDALINSKAQEETMPQEKLKDDNLTGETGDWPGRAITNKENVGLHWSNILDRNTHISGLIHDAKAPRSELEDEPLTSYYDVYTYTIKHINLGLIEKHDPDFAITQTLAYTKIKMKGYTYTYEYGGKQIESDQVPVVYEQNSKKTFSGALYPTDIAYNMAESTRELEVYVVYRIDVKNLETMNVPNKYIEKKLYLESLTDAYDKSRYDLVPNENNNDSKDFALWSGNDGTAAFDVYAEDSDFKDGLKPLEIKSALVQFKVKEEILEKILKNSLDYEDIEEAPTVATVHAAHEYIRQDNLWKPGVKRFEGCRGADGYGMQDKDYLHKSRIRDHSSAQLFLTLKLGNERSISGTVFEDLKTENSEKENTNLGNGIMEENEKDRAEKVTVALMNPDKTTITKLYQKTGDDNVYSVVPAELQTEVGGTYEFVGVVPGIYWIRFTYGDGTQTMMPANQAIKSNDYKSTIINTQETGAGNYIKNAMETPGEQMEQLQQQLLQDYSNDSAKQLVEWYKYLNSNTYSLASDDLTERKSVKEFIYKEDGKVYNTDGTEITDYPVNVNSYTPMFSISIENDINNIYSVEGNATELVNPLYQGFNLGLIKEIDVALKLEKKITWVDLSTTDGTTTVNANPKDGTKELSALDKIPGGSKYARIEIEENKIYGSALTTTYQIVITNNSVKDYIEVDETSPYFGYYYKYGDKTYAKLKEVGIEEVLDELDTKYDKDHIPQDTQEIVNHTKESRQEEYVESKVYIAEKPLEENGGIRALSITGWDKLESGAKTTIEYKVKSQLESNSKDTLFKNDARISKLSLDYLAMLNNKFEWNVRDKTSLAIVPNTGEDRSNTYPIVWLIGLTGMAVILVIIRKITKK